MAAWEITTANSIFSFDATPGVQVSPCWIDSSHWIAFWLGNSNDGFTQVFTVNTSTWAISTSGSTLEFDTVDAASSSCAMIDSTHFINFWSGAGDDGFVQVFTVNTTTWAVTTAAARLEFDVAYCRGNSCWMVDSNHFINFWSGSSGDDGFTQIFAINTSTWVVTTAAASIEFDTGSGRGNSCYKIDATHFINFWDGIAQYARSHAEVFIVNTTTWAITTAVAKFQFDTTNGGFNSCEQIDTNHFINFWCGNQEEHSVQVLTVNTSTWEITTAGTRLDFDTGAKTTTSRNTCQKIDTNHFINFWQGTDDDGFTQVFEVNTTTWAVTTVAAAFEFDTTTGNSCGSLKIDTNHIINYWSSGVQVFTVELPSGTKTQVNIGDAWKTVTSVKVNIGDSWKTVTGVDINIGDAWKKIY